MQSRLLRILSLCLLFLSASAPLRAQEHSIHRPEQKWLKLAGDQFAQGNFELARQSAQRAILEADRGSVPFGVAGDRQKARFYLLAASLKANSAGAADSAMVALRGTWPAAFRDRLSLFLAQHYFRKNMLADAIPLYQQAGIAHLSNEEIADAKFELAYSYFNNRQFEEAKPLFKNIRNLAPGSKYYSAGNYYYGLLAYHDGEYEEALASFERIDNEPQYRNIVPYYIAEIYYFTGQRKKALDEALRLIQRTDKLYYDNELRLLAAQVLFEDSRFGEALPYFEEYYSKAERVRKEELYEMAYSYYRVNEWPSAIEKFKALSNTRDSLGQTAMYLLGDSYLKTKDKRSARNAFGIAAEMPYNQGQREAALLLYARISYELGFNDEAMRSVATMIREYPASGQLAEAQTLQSELFLTSGNYRAALEGLQGVRQQNAAYNATLQRASYGVALLELQAGRLAVADSLLSISLRLPVDRTYEAAARFWKSDVAYKSSRPVDAVREGELFINLAGNGTAQRLSVLSPAATIQHAQLTMGYSAMDAKDYATARTYFVKARTGSDNRTTANASLREADAAFMLRDFGAAATLYDRVQSGTGSDADYARLQRATLLGLQGKTADKIAVLQSLVNAVPPSSFSQDARYELGTTYLETRKYEMALEQFAPLVAQNGAWASKALLKTAATYGEMDKDEQAITAYRRVVNGFPASEERSAALEALKTLYIEANQPEAYAQLLQESGLAGMEDADLDSAYYAAAEARYAASDWRAATLAFDRYLQKYPQGVFSVKANYYRGESLFQSGNPSGALTAYDAVLSGPQNDFTEESARRAAGIAYVAANYGQAAQYFGRLRDASSTTADRRLAYAGLMRCAGAQNDFTAAAAFADTLLTLPELDETAQSEARFYKAKQLQATGATAEAVAIFRELQTSKNAGIAAEARYNIAAYFLAQNQLKEAEDAANRAIKQSAGQDFWIVKSYLILADVLTAQKDYFNAKALLESIIRNNKNETLRGEATRRLEAVKNAESGQSKLSNE